MKCDRTEKIDFKPTHLRSQYRPALVRSGYRKEKAHKLKKVHEQMEQYTKQSIQLASNVNLKRPSSKPY
jgi:hypothetical protein